MTPSERKRVRQLRAEGKSYADIVKITGLPRTSVWRNCVTVVVRKK